jgi:probable addiction module antidote protein
MKPSVPYKDILIKELRDPEEALGYLQACLEDTDPRVFLIALRNVVQAQCGMSKLSRHSRINREHLYDLLSKRGNPGFLMLQKILSSLGYTLTIQRGRNHKKAA